MPICCESHVIEGVPSPADGYDGSPLLRCSRCKLTYYKDKDSQRKQWKLHKYSCRELSTKQKERIDAMSLAEASKYLMKQMEQVDKNWNDCVHVIQQIRKLYDQDAPDPNDVELELHAACRRYIFWNRDILSYTFYARPGMAVYLLTDEQEDLLNPKTRLLKTRLGMYNGKPCEDYIKHCITDEAEKERVKQACQELEQIEEEMGYDSPSSMKFCYLYYNLIVAAAIHGNVSHASVHDGIGKLRGVQFTNYPELSSHSLGVAALRRALSLWSDPCARASCGDAMAPAASLALTAVQNYAEKNKLGRGDWCLEGKDELVPGLTPHGAVLACLSELSEHAASSHYSLELLNELSDLQKHGMHDLWSSLSVAQRATVARAILSYLEDHGTEPQEHSYDTVPVPLDSLQVLLETSCGGSSENGGDVQTRKLVWEACSEDESLGPKPCGHNDMARAFFFHLRRSDSDDRVNMIEEFAVWTKLPDPTRAKDDNMDSALEKHECLALARGPALHDERERFLAAFAAALRQYPASQFG